MADPEAAVSIRDRLLKERNSLLDLSTRNRLLNTPLRTKNNRAIEIVDEKTAEVFRLLTAGRGFSFLPGTQLSAEDQAGLDPDDDVTGGIPQPASDELDERGVSTRHADTRLQTRLTSEGLQKRLFDVWYDAQTLEQEQGVNILYLAIGLLRWFDSAASDVARHAPLVLLPVKLERSSVADKFKLKWREEPPSPNLTLQAKMKAEFALAIEDFKDEDEVDLAGYCARVAATVSSQKRWEVLPDAMVLGFFSFSKFLMYRDLDPDNWPKQGGIDQREMIAALLRDGFPETAPLIGGDDKIDDVIRPLELHHVVDADSSQTVVIAEAAGGRSLVVKGPPGTGKSQTITNIIAAAVARGKKVLFVAEKMAALDVVHRRLRQVGLGPLTLELHSNKVNKRIVLEELKRTRDAEIKPGQSSLTVIQKLGDVSDELNAFANRLHAPLQSCGLSAQAILGLLARAGSTRPPSGVALEAADSWDREAVATRRGLAEDLADRARALGSVPAHAWRGVARGALDPVERQEIAASIGALDAVVRKLMEVAAAAAKSLDTPPPVAVGDLKAIAGILAVTPLPDGLDRSTVAAAGWANLALLRRTVAAGAAYRTAWDAVSPFFTDAGSDADLTAIGAVIAAKGESLFRVFDGSYRRAVRELHSYLAAPPPRGRDARLALLDAMSIAQAARFEFRSLEPHGEVFGEQWLGETSDWAALEGVLAWRTRHAGLPAASWVRLAATEEVESLDALRRDFDRVRTDFTGKLEGVVAELDLNLRRAFNAASVDDVPLAELGERLAAWLSDMEGLSRFIGFASRAESLAGMGCSALVDALHDGDLDHQTLRPAFDAAYAEVLRTVLFKAWPELRGFDGESHNIRIAAFRQLDRARIALAQEQIVAAHAEGRPRGAAGIGPLGVLNAEIAKKRAHLPIRLLLDKAGPAIQQLKPVFMMSPLSVAQFLKPGGLQFDLLVMDEASQIEPVDSLGAIARADQIVVVGDERQLPPTTFFKKLTGEDDPDEADDGVVIQAKDAESILELCLAKGVPHRMLSWHYRSKHQSLIAVSNREFYENKLFIVPSPFDAVAGMGLKFNLMKDTAYDRGGTRTNPLEAKAIAEAVVRHARSNPEQSLGVATFSVAQRQAVLKELELLRRANPDVEPFFAAASHEPFFVKNLENI